MSSLPAYVEETAGELPALEGYAGEAFPKIEAAAAIALGLASLLIAGLMGLLFGVLAEEGRLSVSGIGLVAMLEALSTGLVTGLAGIVLKPRRLRLIAAASTALAIVADLATTQVSGGALMTVRTLAGIPEGLMLWISIGLISRSVTPERLAGLLFTGMGVTQLAAASAISFLVLPRFGANGGFLVLALLMVSGLVAAAFLPTAFSAGPGSTGGGAPPLRGWVALFGTLCLAAAMTGVAVYTLPLAAQAGAPQAAGRLAISSGLACQILGGALATLIAGRVRYIWIFWICVPLLLGVWLVYGLSPPAWMFVAAAGVAGGAAMVAGPFFVPMTIEADPSRRAAMQSGAVQLLAGALGPFLTSRVVAPGDAHGALALGGGLLIVGLLVISALHWTARR